MIVNVNTCVLAIGIFFIFRVRPLQTVRSTTMGNSRASERENGQKYGSHAFFFIIIYMLQRRDLQRH